MPRPRRAQGRPGTPIIPRDWEESHAIPAGKFRTATITITAPAGPVTVNDDLTYTPLAPPPVVYTGTARVQVLTAQESTVVVGDQQQTTIGYLVSIDRNTPVPFKAVGTINSCSDPTLVGRRLVVEKIDRGSLTWERDLYCSEDQTAPDPDDVEG